MLAGASGLVGSHCLGLLLANAAYGRVHVLVRTQLPIVHPNLVQHCIDFDRLEHELGVDQVDDVYCCLGTTIRKAGSQSAFRRVDFDYPVALARAVAQRGATRFLLVSALGADAGSSVFYNRVKGEVERAVAAIGIPHVCCFRPSLLLGPRTEFRPGERAGIVLARLIGPVLAGPLARYRAIPAGDVAAAMVYVALHGYDGASVESERIASLARQAAAAA